MQPGHVNLDRFLLLGFVKHDRCAFQKLALSQRNLVCM